MRIQQLLPDPGTSTSTWPGRSMTFLVLLILVVAPVSAQPLPAQISQQAMALVRAAELQPASPQNLFNLGVAYALVDSLDRP